MQLLRGELGRWRVRDTTAFASHWAPPLTPPPRQPKTATGWGDVHTGPATLQKYIGNDYTGKWKDVTWDAAGSKIECTFAFFFLAWLFQVCCRN